MIIGYISDNGRRFHVFVVNRVQHIRDCTNQYVETDLYPADDASSWWNGPDFLWKPLEDEGSIEAVEAMNLSPNDPKVKKTQP